MRAFIAASALAIVLLAAGPASATPVPVQLIAETGTAKVVPTPIEIHLEAFARNATSGGKASCDAAVTGTADYGPAAAHNSVRIVQR